MPGVDHRQMKKMMQRMGIQQIEIPAYQVIIKTPDKELVINQPEVLKVNMMGQESYQITGKAVERSIEPEPSEEDLMTVMDQTGATSEQAKDALKKNRGDLAKTIIQLSSK